MSYQSYVFAAYSVFAIVLLWDFVVPQLQLRQQLRAARLRARRTPAPGVDHDAPLTRN
ncbi:MAG: heme exporter protein CcmD [Luteimonas sp.]